MKALYEPPLPHLGQTEINKDGSDTKDDLENDKNNDDPFESFSVGRIDTLFEKFEHILKNLSRQLMARGNCVEAENLRRLER